MSDSNIYMAFSTVSLLSIAAFQKELEWKFEERVEAGEGGTEGRLQLQNRGWSISDAICPPHYFRIRWSPSLSSSLTVQIKKQLSSGKL